MKKEKLIIEFNIHVISVKKIYYTIHQSRTIIGIL